MTWSSSSKAALALIAALGLAGAGNDASKAPVSGSPILEMPVACDMTRDCSIQKYVDRDPGPRRLDYRCGSLTTDDHAGTDFRLRRFPDLQRNVAVLAAAAGRVARIRDGMQDISVTNQAAEPIGDRLAGNAVVLDHGDGWETQYSHLKQGSLTVRPGDRVVAGAKLGEIGMSGNAEYPHLHFDVRHDGRKVDPFSSDAASGCGQPQHSLWSISARNKLAYYPTVVLSAGLAGSTAEARTAFQNAAPAPRLPNPSALVLWGNVSGVQSGDVQKFRVLAPNRGVLLEQEIPILQDRLHWIGFAGLKRPTGGWNRGMYVGTYQLVRNGQVLGEITAYQYLS